MDFTNFLQNFARFFKFAAIVQCQRKPTLAIRYYYNSVGYVTIGNLFLETCKFNFNITVTKQCHEISEKQELPRRQHYIINFYKRLA